MSRIHRNSFCTRSAALYDTDTLGLFGQQETDNNAVKFELQEANGSLKKLRAFKKQDWWWRTLGEGPLH
jgi:hypothetical protein